MIPSNGAPRAAFWPRPATGSPLQTPVVLDISSLSFFCWVLRPSDGAAPMPAQQKPEKEYDDIPGTYVFDADRSRRGYHLNMFCMSLMKAENRKAFKENEAKYLDDHFSQLTAEQREAILKRQYNRMLELGGNIYFTAKLGATDGHPFQHLAALMTGSTQQDYADLMLRGGRPVDGNRSKSGKFEKKASKSKAASKGKKRRG